jgi:hypothetical protein
MTREEEIIGESYKIFPLNSDKRQAFIRGAKYADQNPAPNLVDIDKVCERLKSNFNHEEDIDDVCDFLKSNFPNELLAIAMIEQSKQAMKKNRNERV